jgi:rod shape determining protein RodA
MTGLEGTQGSQGGALRLAARWHLDGILLSLLLSIMGISLIVLYSATGQDFGAVIGQGKRLAVGLVVLLLCAQISPETYRALTPWFYVGTLLVLVLVLLLGDASKGAQRWLDLGVIRFQPSEMMKLAMPMAIAAYLHGAGVPPGPRRLMICLMLIAVPTGLVALQPDLGTSIMIVTAGLFAIYLGGLSWKWISGFIGLGLAAVPLLWFVMHDYQQARVLTFLNPERDPLGAGYHITQSKIAIGSGGMFGKGWGEGTQASLDFLPESHTDFVFAVFAEELGLLGVAGLLLLYVLVMGRGLLIALRGQDTFQRLLAGSLALTFFVYLFVNVGMVCGLLPVVGVPMPLMSYGGTSMVSLLAGFGILMSIQTHRKLVSS